MINDNITETLKIAEQEMCVKFLRSLSIKEAEKVAEIMNNTDISLPDLIILLAAYDELNKNKV